MKQGVLTVSGISRDEGGLYTVTAVNSEGMTSYNFTLNVQCEYTDLFELNKCINE